MRAWREGERARIDGRVSRIRFETEDGDFQVLIVEAGAGRQAPAIVRGAALREGDRVTLEGPVRRHKSGELQLEAESVERVLPKTAEGIGSYLASASVHGIGPKLAADIVGTFGEATLAVLDQTPERLREVPGIGKKRAAAIAEHWKGATAVREVMVFLQSRGVSAAYAARIHRTYGAKAVRIVEADPYRLARDIRGIGFRVADRIARAGGIAQDDPRRVDAGVEHALQAALDDGHVLLPEPVLVEAASGLLGASTERVGEAISRLEQARRIVGDDTGSERGWYLRDVRDCELELAGRIRGLVGVETRLGTPGAAELATLERGLGFALASGQRRGLEALLGGGVGVLTGGPGTGKTTIVRAAVRYAALRRKTVLLCAPTGRAAKRLTESTGEEARTLHRALGFDPRLGDFTRGVDDPLQVDLVVVDEASMLDQELALALLRALVPGTSLLLVGDVEQLPSVGPGNVLSDVISSSVVPVARLDQVYRQAGDSGIIRCAHEVRSGRVPAPSDRPDGDYFFIECGEPDRVVDVVRRVVVERMPEAFGLSPLDDIQCLTPMNSGPVGTRALNAALQSALGIGGPALVSGERRLHAGDKVMQVRNNYDLDVFNGDIGVVRSVDVERVSATVEFDGREVRYERDALDELTLAYAVSVHKAQGSEFRAVVLVLTTHHFKLLQRNLVYTALTRARERLVVVGSSRALRMAIDGVSEVRRHTRLAARLSGHGLGAVAVPSA